MCRKNQSTIYIVYDFNSDKPQLKFIESSADQRFLVQFAPNLEIGIFIRFPGRLCSTGNGCSRPCILPDPFDPYRQTTSRKIYLFKPYCRWSDEEGRRL